MDRWEPRTNLGRVVLVFALTALDAVNAHAQTAPIEASGPNANRLEPAERGSAWFGNDSLSFGDREIALGVAFDFQSRPLAAYLPDGRAAVSMVRDQWTVHPGAAASIAGFRLGLSVPVLVYGSGASGIASGARYTGLANEQALGDVRASIDYRLLGEPGGIARFAIGARLWLPTGDRNAYVSDGATRAALRIGVAGDANIFSYAAEGAFELRGRTEAALLAPVGSGVTLRAAAGVKPWASLLLGPEVIAATLVTGDVLGIRATPVEALLGAHYLGDHVHFGLGGGARLTRGYGAPEARAMLSFEWIIATTTNATREPHARSSSNAPAPARPVNGSDRDRDGIADDEDACPIAAGIVTRETETNGCPDNDSDGIPDKVDSCPDDPGVPEIDPAKNGCPKARLREDQVVLLEPVGFEAESARIISGEDVLLSIARVLSDHPGLARVRVEAHAANRTLALARAGSVIDWLVEHGIARARLASGGMSGSKTPHVKVLIVGPRTKR